MDGGDLAGKLFADLLKCPSDTESLVPACFLSASNTVELQLYRDIPFGSLGSQFPLTSLY